ncbi:hypothetical protein ACOYW6_09440 [Parablastomonas sp. CN1-191]|uniref:hypothetical protein n=1 Tax=Parablastomonas sp. CN1-191 TaxID=3400908 RepID=UPI003BF88719
MGKLTALAMAALLLPAAGPGNAQSMTAEEALAAAQGRTGADSVSRRCRPSSGDEIVVCADRGEDQRVPPTSETDPNSRAAREVRDGDTLRPPQMDRGSCRGQPGCVIGGWAPPPVYYVDLDKIPKPPAGSDADKVAKGELRN